MTVMDPVARQPSSIPPDSGADGLAPFGLIGRSGRIAFLQDGDIWTCARLAMEVDRLSVGLRAMGLLQGERVALHLRNGPEIAISYHACFRLGLIAVPLNLRFKPPELENMLGRVRPALYIGHADLCGGIDEVPPSILAPDRRVVVGACPREGAIRWSSLLGDPEDATLCGQTDPDGPAVLLSTSGTTGQPKLVAHSLRTLAHITGKGAQLGLRAGDRVAFFLPMVHMSGLWTFLAGLRLGLSMVMIDGTDPDVILDAIAEHRCSLVASLPGTAVQLARSQQRRRRDMTALRCCLTAGDVCPAGLQERFAFLFGRPLFSFWAATEAMAGLTYAQQPGPVSRPLPDVEIRLVDVAGMPVPAGEAGEMLVRGPCVSLGYWSGPGVIETAPDGWHRTGDLMREDADGNLWFVSRLKDLILRNGSNISPVEVEQVLLADPAVQDAAVVGVPDAVLGQRVIGFVTLSPGADEGCIPAILRHASKQLADYKLPEWLLAVDAIPRNGLGKIDRQRLAETSLDLAEPP